MTTLSVGDTIRFAWHTFAKRPGFFIGILLMVTVFSGIVSRIFPAPAAMDGGAIVAILALFLVGLVIDVFLKMGSINVLLRAHDDPARAHIADLWAPSQFWSYLAAGFLSGILTIAGLILLIIPGIYLALRFLFVPYLVIDRKLRPMEALRESSRITHGHKGELLKLVVSLIGINILGAILLLVGLLVTIPLTMIAIVHAYRVLESSASAVTRS